MTPFTYNPQAAMLREARLLRRKRVRNLVPAAPFVLPGLLLACVFVFYPMFFNIRISFSDIDEGKVRAEGGAPAVLRSSGVAYITGPLFFGAVDEFNHRRAAMPAYDHVILSMRGMPSVDVSGAQAMLELCQSLREKGISVACCGMSESVRSYFDRAGITELLGESAYFWSADQAILDLLDVEIVE